MEKSIYANVIAAIVVVLTVSFSHAFNGGWNSYHCRDSNLVFIYPSFLNKIEVRCTRGSVPKQWETNPPAFTEEWPYRNWKHTVLFSAVNESENFRRQVMSVSIYDNPEGDDLLSCATALVTSRINEASGGAPYHVKCDSLMVGKRHILHVSSFFEGKEGDTKYADLYVLCMYKHVLSVSIVSTWMLPMLTDEYGDTESVIEKILGSFEYRIRGG